MVVGVLEVRLMIRESQSLKDKRRALRSIKDRIRGKYNVSIAEVDSQNNRQQAVLGIAMVGSDHQYVEGALSKVVDTIRWNPRGAELLTHHTDFY